MAAGEKGSIKVDLTTLNSGVAKRDQDRRQPQCLDTADEANKFANMTVPQMLMFKLSNEIELETDLTSARQ